MYIHTSMTVLNRSIEEVLNHFDTMEDVMIVECPVHHENIVDEDKTYNYGASNVTLLHHTDFYQKLMDELLMLLAENKIELVSCSLTVGYTIKPLGR